MKKLLLAQMVFVLSPGFAMSYQSTHLKQFNLVQCLSRKCIRASGDLAFMAMTNDTMAASDVKLELAPSMGQNRSLNCARFRMDLNSQFLICDNQNILNQPSLTIDSKLNISIFYPSIKRTKS